MRTNKIYMLAMLVALVSGSALFGMQPFPVVDPGVREVKPVATLPMRPLQTEHLSSLADVVIPGTMMDAGRLHVMEMLIGQVPGVWVTGTPFYYRVRVRGALAPPIIVIDNFPFYNLDDERVNDLLLMIPPQDVERIEVIKNIAGASFYGPGAGNGVIRIFTKRGDTSE